MVVEESGSQRSSFAEPPGKATLEPAVREDGADGDEGPRAPRDTQSPRSPDSTPPTPTRGLG